MSDNINNKEETVDNASMSTKEVDMNSTNQSDMSADTAIPTESIPPTPGTTEGSRTAPTSAESAGASSPADPDTTADSVPTSPSSNSDTVVESAGASSPADPDTTADSVPTSPSSNSDTVVESAGASSPADPDTTEGSRTAPTSAESAGASSPADPDTTADSVPTSPSSNSDTVVESAGVSSPTESAPVDGQKTHIKEESRIADTSMPPLPTHPSAMPKIAGTASPPIHENSIPRRHTAYPRTSSDDDMSASRPIKRSYSRADGLHSSSGRESGEEHRGDRSRSRGRLYYRQRVDKIKVHKLTISYRNPEVLRRFTTETGVILPRRITGTSAKNQRKLVREIKRARFLALLPMG